MVARVNDPSFRQASQQDSFLDESSPVLDLKLSEAERVNDRNQVLLKGIRSVSGLIDNTQQAIRDIPDALAVPIDDLKEGLTRAAELTNRILDFDVDTTQAEAIELIEILEGIDNFFKSNPKIDIGDSSLREILRTFEQQGNGQTLATESLESSLTEVLGESFGKGSAFASDLAANIDAISRNRLTEGMANLQLQESQRAS